MKLFANFKKLIMTLPSLPTDNLYKFGFVGFIFLLSLIFYTRSSEKENLLKIKSEYDINYLQTLELKEYFISNKDSSEVKKADVNRKISKANDQIEDIKNRISDFNSQSLFYNCLMVVCFILALFFLYLWYNRLQKYQDIIVKNEAEDAIN